MQWETVLPNFTSYLKDESHAKGQADCIFFPTTIEDAVDAVKDAKASQKTLTFQGSRTGFLGGALATGGAILNFSKLQSLSDIKEENGHFYSTVTCGVTLEELQRVINSKNLFFPVEPTEETATLGGIFATDAKGPSTYFYGSIRKYLHAIDFVTVDGDLFSIKRNECLLKENQFILPNGKILSVPKAMQSSVTNGMDILDFLVGTEGYFGAVLSLKLELLPIPKESFGVVFFLEKEVESLDFLEKIPNLQTADSAHLLSAEYFNGAALEILKAHSSHPLLKKLPPLPKADSAIYLEFAAENEDDISNLLMQYLDLFETVGGQEENSWAESGKDAIAPLQAMRHALVSILNEEEIYYGKDGYRLESDVQFLLASPKEVLSYYLNFAKEQEIEPILYGSIAEGELHLALPNALQNAEILSRFYKALPKENCRLFAKYGIGKKNAAMFKK